MRPGNDRSRVSAHGLLPDDTVATAAAKLEALLGSPVHLWCLRPVDAHEALAIAVAAGAHETGGAYSPRVAAREARARLGLQVTPAQAGSPLKLLRWLQRQDDIREPVAMRNRFVIPGGYFEHSADPYDDTALRPPAARPFNTADLLLESFHTDELLVTTARDLEAARPADVSARAWREGFVARYVPDAPDRDLFKWTPAAERRLREQRQSDARRDAAVTYLPVTGGTPVGEVGMDRIMEAFASARTTPAMPMLRVQGGGIDRPVARVQRSLPEEARRRLRSSAKREWLQALFVAGKGSCQLLVFPNGAYKLQVRFGYLEKARLEDAVAYLEPVNALLKRVSPMIRPVLPRHLTPSSSLYIQKPQLLETPSVLGGPRNGVYQTVALPLPAVCTVEEVARIVEARGFPSLKAVNVHGGELHMQWVRSSGIRKASIVKNLVHHNASNGGLSLARVDALAAELGMTRQEVAEVAAQPFSRHTVLTLAKARVTSDTTLTVQVNGNDPGHAARVAQTLANLLRECGRGRARGESDWSKTVSDSPGAFGDDLAPSSALDEFYEFFEDDDDAAGAEEPEAPGPPGDLAVIRQKGDILERLKQADPEVFAFPSQPGYVPYSMKCQKNNATTRQPLVLTDEGLAAALEGSSAAGRKALASRLRYRGLTYVCPEKWCAVSGVARGLAEDCPDPDEPQWTMWNQNHPMFQPGVAHPKGLCMPCCFGSAPKKGLKNWNVLERCKRDAGEPLDEGVPDPAREAGRVKTGHINKADKLLEEGAYGFVPDALFPGGAPPGDRPVRRGMGLRKEATLGRSLAFLLGHRTEAALKRALARALLPEHFVQADVREFMAGAPERPTKTAVRRWATREYLRVMGLREADIDGDVLAREARVMAAHAECARRLEADGPVSNTSLLRLVNSGALEGPPVMLLEVDEAGNAYAEHCQDRAMPAAGHVLAVLKRRDTHEPLGRKRPKGSFDPRWDAGLPWVRLIFDAVARALPPGGRRVVSFSRMAVGCLRPSGYLPYARPVFVDPAHPHANLSDLPAAELAPASEQDARDALEATGSDFYRFAWREVARSAPHYDATDALLFGPAQEDTRSRVMADTDRRVEQINRTAAWLRDNVPPAELAPLPGEDARARLGRVRRAVAADMPDPPTPEVVDFAAETVRRPVPAGTVPSVDYGPDEEIVYSVD